MRKVYKSKKKKKESRFPKRTGKKPRLQKKKEGANGDMKRSEPLSGGRIRRVVGAWGGDGMCVQKRNNL